MLRYLPSIGDDMRETLIDCGNSGHISELESYRRRSTPAGEDLMSDDFEKFLIWLDPSREQAGRAYEKIRTGLIRMFGHYECAAAEELADETINRVIRSVHRIANSYVGEPMAYFYAVARRLRFEQQRRPVTVGLDDNHSPVSAMLDEASEEDDRRLEWAMNRLSASDRELILRYYQGEGRGKIDHRQRLAEELGVGLNALRIRVHRIRTELKQHLGLGVA